jgi:hypothetical protein
VHAKQTSCCQGCVQRLICDKGVPAQQQAEISRIPWDVHITAQHAITMGWSIHYHSLTVQCGCTHLSRHCWRGRWRLV